MRQKSNCITYRKPGLPSRERDTRENIELDYSWLAKLHSLPLLFEITQTRIFNSFFNYARYKAIYGLVRLIGNVPNICSRRTSLSPLSLLSSNREDPEERTDHRTIKLNSSVPWEFHDESNRNSRLRPGGKEGTKKKKRKRMSKRPAVPQCGHRGPINPPPPVRFRVKRMEGFIGLSGCPHPRDLESNCR